MSNYKTPQKYNINLFFSDLIYLHYDVLCRKSSKNVNIIRYKYFSLLIPALTIYIYKSYNNSSKHIKVLLPLILYKNYNINLYIRYINYFNKLSKSIKLKIIL